MNVWNLQYMPGKVRILIRLVGMIVLVVILLTGCGDPKKTFQERSPLEGEAMLFIDLPEPQVNGEMTVEAAIGSRRSVRSYRETAVSLQQVSQLLWAAQGISADGRLRNVPSAGALYPLTVWVIAGNVEDLSPGVYRFLPATRQLEPWMMGDFRKTLQEAALNQEAVGKAPVSFVITADYSILSGKYGSRAARFSHMEAGHAAQNLYLQAESLLLGTVTIGGYEDAKVLEALFLPEREVPLCIMPVGEKQE